MERDGGGLGGWGGGGFGDGVGMGVQIGGEGLVGDVDKGGDFGEYKREQSAGEGFNEIVWVVIIKGVGDVGWF